MKSKRLRTTYRVPVQVAVYVEAESPQAAADEVELVLRHLPEQASYLFVPHGFKGYKADVLRDTIEVLQPSLLLLDATKIDTER